MKRFWSATSGFLAEQQGEGIPCRVVNILDGKDVGIAQLQSLSCIEDWEALQGDLTEASLKELIGQYRICRISSLGLHLLNGLSNSLALRAMEELEQTLQTSVPPDALLGELLLAPLVDEKKPRELARSCLSHGFGALAKVFEELSDLQPLLRRMTDQWLAIQPELFASAGASREQIWCRLHSHSLIRPLLQSRTRIAFMDSWNALLLLERAPSARIGLGKIGNALCSALHLKPQNIGPRIKQLRNQDNVVENESPTLKETGTSEERLDRVLKEIGAIAAAVAKGHDAQAHKYLRGLLDRQLSTSKPHFAVQSLCNIAKMCADMFRTDFERECLELALNLDPTDPWAQVQWGDHLKRQRQFPEAISALEKVVHSQHADVAISNIADVWVQQGEYERAITIYKTLQSWEENLTVRTAIADVLRRQGKLDEAHVAYEAIEVKWPNQDRVSSGLAEVAKRRGNLPEALKRYEDLVSHFKVSGSGDSRALIIYRLAKCNLLKLLCRLPEAYRDVDKIVEDYPFLMGARILRGSILGLLDRPEEGLQSIPTGAGQNALGEWRRYYVRGLLLLQLNRFGEARSQLLDNLQTAAAAKEDETLVRLAGAVAFLNEGNWDSAARLLNEVHPSNDYFIDHLVSVLSLHLAAKRQDATRIRTLVTQLNLASSGEKMFGKVAEELQRGDFRAAMVHELALFLRTG